MKDMEPAPVKILFYNSGVHLVSRGSELLDDIKALEAGGVELLACGTCLEYFKLKDKLAAGRVSNMYEIAGSMFNASIIVKP